MTFSRFRPAVLAIAAWWLAAPLVADEPAAPSDTPVEADSTEPAKPAAERAAELPAEIRPEPKAALPRVGDYHRAALHVDPVEAAVARGDWHAPTVGGQVTAAAGDRVAWQAGDAERDRAFAGGYAYAEFSSPAAGVMLLEAPGAAAVCLNGEWVPGDPYGYGWFRLPVEVVEGENWMLTHLASPAAAPRLVRPAAPLSFVAEAATLPDIVAGRPEELAISVPLLNASRQKLAGCRLRVRWGDDEPVVTPLRSIESLLLTPITVKLAAPSGELKAGATTTVRIEVLPADADDQPLAAVELTLRVVSPVDPRTDTFVSDVDGSVQPYGVLPAADNAADRGVVVSLHDAGESHAERLGKHTPAASADIIVPAGRGRWAFDWEDWSRTDALEALDDFVRRQKQRGAKVDERRVSVVGEGMGGHGALRLATLRPDRFAAVGITDGWLSFFTQGGALVTPSDATPVARLLGRAPSADDPLRIVENLRGMGVSLLHAGHPDVAPSEARYLRERLGEFHNDFAYRDAEDADARSLLQGQIAWLTTRRLPDYTAAETIDFATPSPGAASTLGWATIISPQEQGRVARVRLTRDLERREVRGTTENVRRLRLSLESLRDAGPIRVRLDGGREVRFQASREAEVLSLARDSEGVWRRVPDRSPVPGLFKEPERAGGFKSAFCCRPYLVFGTRGADDERRWMAAKARYDAHLFLYRGAGLMEVVADVDLRDALRIGGDASRSVVLYGAAPANSAWFALQQEAFLRRSRTVRVERGRVWLGERPESGDDLAVLAVRPRPGSTEASIAVVGGTGITGMRMTTRLRYFWSGVEYPDFLLYGPEAIDSPSAPAEARDVRAAGYFDADWGVDSGGVVWRDLAL